MIIRDTEPKIPTHTLLLVLEKKKAQVIEDRK